MSVTASGLESDGRGLEKGRAAVRSRNGYGGSHSTVFESFAMVRGNRSMEVKGRLWKAQQAFFYAQ